MYGHQRRQQVRPGAVAPRRGEDEVRHVEVIPATVCGKHAAFHREAAKVGSSINSGDMKTASAALENGTPYTNASSAVAVAILALKKEASL